MEELDDFAGGSAAPSDRLQVYEPKDFPYLNTGKSLVFVIARNGMVWGKRLDEQSSKGDIELEVFWPREDGCLMKYARYRYSETEPSDSYSLLKHRKHYPKLSIEQDRKIESILSQKETIQYELGTLMVRPFVTADPNYKDWRHLPQYQRMKTQCKLDFPLGEPCNIKVVDCLYTNTARESSMGCWVFFYNDTTCKFGFLPKNIYKEDGKQLFIGTDNNPFDYRGVQEIKSVQPHSGTHFMASIATNGQFDFSHGRQTHLKFKKTLRVMYGEHDFFNFFDVDDAFLMLEEKVNVTGNNIETGWTLGIAQNKQVREMMRLASNNPDLFKPLKEQVKSEAEQELINKHYHGTDSPDPKNPYRSSVYIDRGN